MANVDRTIFLVIVTVLFLSAFLHYKKGEEVKSCERGVVSFRELQTLVSGNIRTHMVLLFILPVGFFLLGLCIQVYQIYSYSIYSFPDDLRFVLSNPYAGNDLQEIIRSIFLDLPNNFRSIFRLFNYYQPVFVFVLPVFISLKLKAGGNRVFLVLFAAAVLIFGGILFGIYKGDSFPEWVNPPLKITLEVLQLYVFAYLYSYVTIIVISRCRDDLPVQREINSYVLSVLPRVFTSLFLVALLTGFDRYIRYYIPGFDAGFRLTRTIFGILVYIIFIVMLPRLVLFKRPFGGELYTSLKFIRENGKHVILPVISLVSINFLLTFIFRCIGTTVVLPNVFLLIRTVFRFTFFFPVAVYMFSLDYRRSIQLEPGRDGPSRT